MSKKNESSKSKFNRNVRQARSTYISKVKKDHKKLLRKLAKEIPNGDL